MTSTLHISMRAITIGGRTLFHDQDLALLIGGTNVILGPSGCGKTTLLRHVAGLGGSAEPAINPGTRISWLAQNDGLLPWKSVRENVLLGPRLRGETIDVVMSRQADDLLDQMGLSEWRDASPDTLSGGMRQRVAIARTLIEDSDIVLMDEPFAALDSLTRLSMQRLAGRMLSGRTIILVTHDLHEAVTMADRLCILEGYPVHIRLAALPDAPSPRDLDEPSVISCVSALRRQLLDAA